VICIVTRLVDSTILFSRAIASGIILQRDKNRANKRLLINERNNSSNNIFFCLCKSKQDYTNIFSDS